MQLNWLFGLLAEVHLKLNPVTDTPNQELLTL